jgi:hypothetical protein
MTRWLACLAVMVLWPREPDHVKLIVALLVGCALLRVLCAGSAKPSTFHGHGLTRQDTSFHEAGHVVIAKHRGASRVSAYVKDNGRGTTWATERSTIDLAIILAAGTEASSHFYKRDAQTSHHDEARLAEVCRQVGITPDQARRAARREVAQYGSEIRDVAERLNRRGHV